MNLGAMTRDAASPLTASQEKGIRDSIDILNLCSDEIRTISYLLHPPLLDEMGLASALSWYSDGFTERSGIRVELDISRDIGRVSPDTETAMFRIFQQSLANIYRHSGSHLARIKIRKNAEEITMMICDEGRGIAPDVLAELYLGTRLVGVGMAGMRERTQVMKGRFRISSGPGGTTIEISFPLTENKAHR
ncbi:MAG TPA: ATP-binding protein [Candidatus Acidoferrales bacterium]